MEDSQKDESLSDTDVTLSTRVITVTPEDLTSDEDEVEQCEDKPKKEEKNIGEEQLALANKCKLESSDSAKEQVEVPAIIEKKDSLEVAIDANTDDELPMCLDTRAAKKMRKS